MKLTLTRVLVCSGILTGFISVNAPAQNLETALSNPVIMHYYTPDQLNELARTDTLELNAVVYYFTQSYSVAPVECYDCLPFDSAQFDVTRFEHLRKQDTIYSHEFTKYGFVLTLYPINSLPYEYAIHKVPQLNPGDKPKQQE